MCHAEILNFAKKAATENAMDITGKRILEIGSRNVNGSVRPFFQLVNPSEYIGIDVTFGDLVDMVLDGCNAEEKFGKDSFDFVVTVETIEHVKEWKRFIQNIKHVLKPNGLLLLTGRSTGFPRHEEAEKYGDYWRFTKQQIGEVFSDFNIIELRDDAQASGFLMLARKSENFVEKEIAVIPEPVP